MVGEEVFECSSEANGLHKSAGETASLKPKCYFGPHPHPNYARGYVYFIRAGEHIKIGYSTRPIDRLKALQTSNPGRLEILGTRWASREFETELHHHFKRWHVLGEWFKASFAIRRYIDQNTPEGIAAWKERNKFVFQGPPPVRNEVPPELESLARRLASQRSKLPPAARPFASNLIGQIAELRTYVPLASDTHETQTLQWAIKQQLIALERAMKAA